MEKRFRLLRIAAAVWLISAIVQVFLTYFEAFPRPGSLNFYDYFAFGLYILFGVLILAYTFRPKTPLWVVSFGFSCWFVVHSFVYLFLFVAFLIKGSPFYVENYIGMNWPFFILHLLLGVFIFLNINHKESKAHAQVEPAVFGILRSFLFIILMAVYFVTSMSTVFL